MVEWAEVGCVESWFCHLVAGHPGCVASLIVSPCPHLWDGGPLPCRWAEDTGGCIQEHPVSVSNMEIHTDLRIHQKEDIAGTLGRRGTRGMFTYST